MAAQLAPFVTLDWIPYFLNRPFSCAMTMGEQSVSAIMPKFTLGASGASLAAAAVAAQVRVPSADQIAAAPMPPAACVRNCRRLSERARPEAAAVDGEPLRGDFMRLVIGLKNLAVKVFAEELARNAGVRGGC